MEYFIFYMMFSIVTASFCVSCVTTGVQEKDKRAEAYYRLGVAKLNENDIQGAFVELKRALEIDSSYKEAYNALGLVYLHLDNYEGAKESFKKAINVDPSYSEAYNNLGLTYAKLNQWKLSEKAFTSALANPLYATPDKACNNLGFSLYRQGKYDEALAAFKSSLKRNPSGYSPYYGLALSYNTLGRYGEASEFLTEAIKHDPNFNGDFKKAHDTFVERKRKASGPEEKDNVDFLEIMNY
ncbi:MAG: tetratricopeptide repeat protein [Nitrospirae bacterium]|nr:tetratricopeptide repeat protein [Nitrospirota bacterium]